MRRVLLVLLVVLIFGTATLATAGPLPRGGEAAAALSAGAGERGSLLSAFVSWLFGLWDPASDTTDGKPPGAPPNAPLGNGDCGSVLDPDGRCTQG
jgi:hypothetical protein